MKRLILGLLFSIYSVLLVANHPIVRNFTRKDYKSGTQNWAITQDANNTMYFANNDGLLVFDGKKWSTIPIKNGTNVRSVVFDGKDRFYASTFNNFGYYQKNLAGRFDYYSLSDGMGIKPNNSNELYNIHINNKEVYFQGDKTIIICKDKEVRKIPFRYNIDASAVVHNTFFVSSKSTGLFMLNGNMFVRIPGSELLINKKICSILPFERTKILIVTSFDGVYVYDGLSIVPYMTGIEYFLRGNQVFCATTNGKQIVYGTVQRGIAIQDIATKNTMYVNTYSGLQNNTVLCAAFDNQQNLWLGLDKGIDYVLLNNPVVNVFGNNNLYGAGYCSFLKNNTLYLGTNQGLYSTNYPIINNPMPLQLQLVKGMEGQVWCLTEIDNTLFCGDDQGAFIIYPDKIERIPNLPGTWAFKKLKNHPDMILGCSYQGLFVLRKINTKWELSHFIKGKFSESSPMFEEGIDGSIWFSHWQKGLFRLYLNSTFDSITQVKLYNEKKGFPTNRNNTIFRIGNEIIFSSEVGLYKYNKQNDRMELYDKWNKLFVTPPSYMRLHEGKNGDVWCVSGRFIGLAKRKANNTYTMDSLTYRTLQPKLIIGFENFNYIDSRNIILGTEDGFSWINTGFKNIGKHTFKVLISSIIATNNKSSNSEIRYNSEQSEQDNVFTHKQNSLRFEFNAPEYRNEGSVEYSYMLENYDQTWSRFSQENTKEYTQLPRGEYVFKVKARNILESIEVETSYSFTILPAWYESTWAFIAYLIIFIFLIIRIIYFINIRSKQGALEMKIIKEQEIKEQQKLFEADSTAKKNEIKELKNRQLQYELRHKAQELANSTMNIIRKNELLMDLMDNISKTSDEIRKKSETSVVLSRLGKMEKIIKQNIENDNNWKRFEQNFDLVYENYLTRLGESYPELNVTDKKICAYIKMDLSSKDMAPLLNMSVRSIETNRYRIRKKMNLERDVNLSDFLQKF